MNKTIKIRTTDSGIRDKVVSSLIENGIIESKKPNRDGSLPFSVKGKVGLCKVYGSLGVSEIQEGLLIKVNGKNGVTGAGIVITFFLIFTILGIILLLLMYYLEVNSLNSKVTEVLASLKEEFE